MYVNELFSSLAFFPHLSFFSITFFSIMGWLRLVGSLKLQVSFAKEPYKRDYILQKSPIILRSLLTVATPYIYLYYIFLCCFFLYYIF